VTDVDAVISAWNDHYDRVDTVAVEVLIASYLSIYRKDAFPLWTLLVASPSSLKTEMCRSFVAAPETVYRDDLSPGTMLSGHRKGKDEDLLYKLSGRVLVVKDLTVILSKPSWMVNAVFGSLRGIYDGFFDKDTGVTGHKAWKGKFAFIVASTAAVDAYQTFQLNLGERFLKVRLHELGEAEEEALQKRSAMDAARNVGVGLQDDIRAYIQERVAAAIEPYRKGFAVREPSSSHYKTIADYASFAARARTPIQHDMRGVPTAMPDVERPPRLAQQLTNLVQCLAVMRDRKRITNHEIGIAKRVAMDCLPRGRLAVIRALAKDGGWMKHADIQQVTGIPKSTLSTYVLTDLQMLRVVRADGDNPGHAKANYRLASRYADLVKEVKF
jgi:hypothetical protein